MATKNYCDRCHEETTCLYELRLPVVQNTSSKTVEVCAACAQGAHAWFGPLDAPSLASVLTPLIEEHGPSAVRNTAMRLTAMALDTPAPPSVPLSSVDLLAPEFQSPTHWPAEPTKVEF